MCMFVRESVLNQAKNLEHVKLITQGSFKRKVFNLFLKTDTDGAFLISYGKAFHNVGAATEKDLAPYVFRL